MKILYCFCIIFFCNVVNSQIKIDLYKHINNSEIVKISEVARSIIYIPLETTYNSLLSDELQIYYAENDIFVGDQKTSCFYRFDKSGKFKNVIGKKGDGPKDYLSAIMFYVDEKANIVYLVSPQTRTLYQYNYEGEFLGKVTFEKVPWNIQKIEDKYLFYNNRFNRIASDEHVKELYLADNYGHIIKELPTTIKNAAMDMVLFEMPFFYEFSGNIFYKNPLLDTVYKVKYPLDIEPYMEIITGPMNRNINDYKDIDNFNDQVSVRNIIESDSSLMIVYAYHGRFNNLWFNKKTLEARNVVNNSPGFYDDIYEGPDILPYWLSSSKENVFVALLTYEEIMEAKAQIENILHKDNESYSIPEDTNPILIVVNLK